MQSGPPRRAGPTSRFRKKEPRRWPLREDFGEAFEGPVDFLAFDDQRGSDADDAVVRLLAKDALLLECFTIRPRIGVELDGDPQSAAADFADDWAVQGAKVRQEIGAEFGGALHKFLFQQDAQRGARQGGRQRVAAEGAAVISRLKNT